jgi:phosphosulfolactate phosphohydrolase-like enzyme
MPLMPGKRAHSKAEKYDLALDNSPMNIFAGNPSGQTMVFTNSTG